MLEVFAVILLAFVWPVDSRFVVSVAIAATAEVICVVPSAHLTVLKEPVPLTCSWYSGSIPMPTKLPEVLAMALSDG